MTDQDIEKHIGSCYNLSRFCELFPNLSKKLVKLTNLEEFHNGLQFKTGYNEDLSRFNPRGTCEPGGIYLTDEDHMPMWLKYADKDMKFCRKVEFCYNSNIYIEKDNKLKVDRLILGERIEIKDLPCWSDKEYCLKALKLSAGNEFEYLNGCTALKFIKNIDEDIQIEAIRNNRRSLSYFLDSGIFLSEKVKIEAVKIQQGVLNFVELLKYNILPSFEIQLIAAKKSGYILSYLVKYLVDNDICSSLSDEIALEAIKQNGEVIVYLCRHKLHISSEMKIEAVKKYQIRVEDAFGIQNPYN